jgi:predicted phage baseplate assembly protein
MGLAAPPLDDLTWADMVAAARQRIAAVSTTPPSKTVWTLHAPVDPGVTLLELFAWLLEQRLYLMDQVSPELTRAILRFLDVTPLGAVPAATVLKLQGDAYRDVAEGTPLRASRRGTPLVFTTDRLVTIVPVTALGLWVGDVECTAELGVNPVPLTVGADGQWRIAIDVTLEVAPPTGSTPTISILVELETSQDVRNAWDPEAPRAVRPPADIEWRHRSRATGQPSAFAADAIDDGTGGLRRSGVVRLPLLPDWEPEPQRAGLVHRLELTTARPTFTFPPRLLALTPNVAAARHRAPVAVPPGRYGWRSLAGDAVIALDADAAPPLPDTVTLALLERAHPTEWQAWRWAADLSSAGPGDRVFLVDRERRTVRFGDGLNGRLPVLADASPNVRVAYVAGGGAAGDFGAGVRFESTADDGALCARNVVPSEGGSDPESPDDARRRSAGDLRKVTRAVLAADYVTLARTTPGVGIARAHAAIGVHPSHPCLPVPGAVTVYLVPYAPRPVADEDWDRDWVWAPVPDPGALAGAYEQLDHARLLGTELFVCPARYRRVALVVDVEGDPHDPTALQPAVSRRLRRFLDPLVGFEGQGWPFGEPVRPSALLREAQDALGNDVAAVGVTIILEGQQPSDRCADVDIGAHHLVELVDVRVRLTRVLGARGGLR